jgi:aminomethyltransferase
MGSGTFKIMHYESAEVLISRTGYTGEDGFEVYGKPNDIKTLWTALLDRGATPCGLGCRDTLRFEASMPLYGHELSKEITPLEAGLTFAVNFNKDFIGKAALLAQKEGDLTRKIVGLELVERGIPREGYPLFIEDKKIGYITTGYLSPTTQKPLAFARVDIAYTALGTPVSVEIRGRRVQAVVRDKKFYQKRNKK